MITKTLESMCTLRGAEGGATGGLIGGWSVYADKNGLENNPLEPPREVGLSKLRDEENDDGRMKRRKLVQGRFGNTSRDDGAAIEDVFLKYGKNISTTVVVMHKLEVTVMMIAIVVTRKMIAIVKTADRARNLSLQLASGFRVSTYLQASKSWQKHGKTLSALENFQDG
jgi:hypothetical protein